MLKYTRKFLGLLPQDLANQMRTFVFRAQAGLHRIPFRNIPAPQAGWPILLQISVLKSGTHLLDQILTGFSRLSPFSPRALYLSPPVTLTGGLYEKDYYVRALQKYQPLDIVKGHIYSSPTIADYINTPNFLTYFIYRDPRDVLVSRAYYGLGRASKNAHDVFYSLPIEQRIHDLIVGAEYGQFRVGRFNNFYRNYIGWLDCRFILHIRYEDLIHHRREELGRIVDHFLARVDTLPASRDQLIQAVESNINPGRSPTFRKGGTGDWKTHFSAEHKKLFKEQTGDLLIKLGYESDHDW
jgi:hypothetical protein